MLRLWAAASRTFYTASTNSNRDACGSDTHPLVKDETLCHGCQVNGPVDALDFQTIF